jgi:hypothetical protein
VYKQGHRRRSEKNFHEVTSVRASADSDWQPGRPLSDLTRCVAIATATPPSEQNMSLVRTLLCATLALALVACSSTDDRTDTTADAGKVDAGAVDGGAVDGGASDAGEADAGMEDPCTNPTKSSDCGECATANDCFGCFQVVDKAGVQAYNALLNCVFCDSCYGSCGGAQAGCPSAPAMKDTCDGDTVSQAACNTCQQCAFSGTCSSQAQACQSNAKCVDIAQNVDKVCGSLP